MLIALTIQNYALIEHLEFRPGEGLSVITGETGAGKSIIMGALGLILGQRAEAKAVRAGAQKCIIEGTFDITRYQLEPYFAENELEYDPENTILRREITAAGKSRAFINDSPVQLQQLKELGQHLIDIHSQHQNLLLGTDTFQLGVVDALAHNQKEREAYEGVYGKLAELRRQIRKLREQAERDAKEADYLRYQYEQLDEADLEENEQEELEQERDLLSHAEDIKSSLYSISEALDNEENSMLSTLRHLSNMAQGLTGVYPDIEDIASRLENDYQDLKDICEDVTSQAEEVNFDQQRLEEVEERLSMIYSLQRKFEVDTVAELINIYNDLSDRIEHIDGSDGEIRRLEAQEEKLAVETAQCATVLSQTRVRAAKELEKALVERVSYLGMPNIRFEANVTSQEGKFTTTGIDELEFLFSANRNQPLKPAGEIASGGEISRLMLSIKALVASARTLPTIIFDEIDTGVSGPIADRMGQVMQELSQSLQVITITHLPQVAGKGCTHFRVYKTDEGDTTVTHIAPLSQDERIREMARMLSGSDITPEALANAKTLLKIQL